MHEHLSRLGSGWTSRLVAMILVAVPVAIIGLASPAAAWGGGDYGTPVCPGGISAITTISYKINATTTVSTLQGNVRSGVSVTATYTVAPGCGNTQASLAAYRAPAATYDRNTADQQVLFDSATGTFPAGGSHTLQIFVPAGCFQVDFVLGAVITHLGPAATNNFYGDQSRLIDHDNNCTSPPPAAPLCDLTAVVNGPPKQLQVTVQDAGSGLKSIVVTTLTNATVVVPTFAVGSAQAYVVVATKVDQTQTAYLGLQVTDTAGLVTNCDPPF